LVEDLRTFVSNENGFIKESYLRNEVIERFEEAKNTVVTYVDQANEIISEVQDIVF